MFALYKKELRSYLTSPMGYVFLAAFYAVSGYYFFAATLVANTNDLSVVFSALFSFVIFLIPMLTMRLFSEERRYKTEQALFTAPVGFTQIVLGKFLACLTIFSLGLSVTVVYAFVLSAFRTPDIPVFLGHLIGLLLLGAALCAIGIYLSSLTENQVIAVITSLGAGMFLLLIDSFTSLTTNATVIALLNAISFYSRFQNFTTGILDIADVVFFLSVAVLFLFLTVRGLERRRIA